MANEPVDPIVPVNVEPGAAPAPVPEPVAPAAPVVGTEPVAPPVEPTAPVEPVAPVVDPAAPVEPAVPEQEPTLLETFDKDKAPDDGTTKPEVKAEIEPTAFNYEYTLPEVITMDDTQRGEVHAALDTFRQDPAKGAQALLDLHAQKMQEYDQQLRNEQVKVWNDTRKQWRDEVLADPQLGGSGHQTAMGVIARMRDLGVPESERESFNTFLKTTGAGDHPAFLRMMHRFGRIFDEPPLPPPNATPPADIGKAPSRSRRDIYDHPNSKK